MSQIMQVPLENSKALVNLKAGDRVLLSGRILTARDAAHRRLIALMDEDKPLPVELKGQIIYYTGPCPTPPGQVIGSCGPTTSGRMDRYTPRMLEAGMAAMIGKGPRSPEVIEAIARHGAVYFAAIGGLGALLADRVRQMRVLAFPELGAEAIHELIVQEFPVIVAVDSYRNDLYQDGPAAFLKHEAASH